MPKSKVKNHHLSTNRWWQIYNFFVLEKNLNTSTCLWYLYWQLALDKSADTWAHWAENTLLFPKFKYCIFETFNCTINWHLNFKMLLSRRTASAPYETKSRRIEHRMTTNRNQKHMMTSIIMMTWTLLNQRATFCAWAEKSTIERSTRTTVDLRA